MITFMINLGVNPTHHDIQPHTDSKYEIKLHECGACHHKHVNYLSLPGIVEHFHTKEEMLLRLQKLASDLWDNAEEIML